MRHNIGHNVLRLKQIPHCLDVYLETWNPNLLPCSENLVDCLPHNTAFSCHRVCFTGASLAVRKNTNIEAIQEWLDDLLDLLVDLGVGVGMREDSVEFVGFTTKH